eukprot:gene10262-12583_t
MGREAPAESGAPCRGSGPRAMPSSVKDQTSDIKNSGLKATLPRIKILEIFQRAAQRHMTAEDVYKALLGEGADIGL